MSDSREKIGASRAYWTHKVDAFPSAVAVTRMAQLIDFDDRLYETARVVYRFMVSWYHTDHGDALLSQRHVAKVMKQRAPDVAAVPSRNAVQRAIMALIETGWVVRSFQGRGRGKGASRYVPVLNVLELAVQGKFPEPAHANGPVSSGAQLAHANGPVVAHANGPVGPEPAHANGPKTLLPDPATDRVTERETMHDCAAPSAPPAPALTAGPAETAQGGFDELYVTYGVRHKKADARAAYDKLAPDAEMHRRMVVAAHAWRKAAGDIRRMHLCKWIEGEHYDEDAPTAYLPKQRRPATAAAPSAKPRAADRTVIIVASSVVRDGFDSRLVAQIEADGSPAGELVIDLESADAETQAAGQRRLAELTRALDLLTVDDSKDLHGRPFLLKADGTYAPVPMQEAA